MIPWNKGKKTGPLSKLHKFRISQSHIGIPKPEVTKALKGKPSPLRGRKQPKTTEKLKGVRRPDISKRMKESYRDDNFKNRMVGLQVKGRTKVFGKINKQEKKIASILRKLKIKFHFTGNGNFIVGGFNPDFKIKSQKKLIEFYGEIFHADPLRFKSNNNIPILNIKARKIWKINKRREREYRKSGYRVLIIWERELKQEEKLKKKLLNYYKR